MARKAASGVEVSESVPHAQGASQPVESLVALVCAAEARQVASVRAAAELLELADVAAPAAPEEARTAASERREAPPVVAPDAAEERAEEEGSAAPVLMAGAVHEEAVRRPGAAHLDAGVLPVELLAAGEVRQVGRRAADPWAAPSGAAWASHRDPFRLVVVPEQQPLVR